MTSPLAPSPIQSSTPRATSNHRWRRTSEKSVSSFVEANTPVYLARVEVVDAVSPARATYRVQFTDAKWAEHLRPGLAWGTESYDIGEPVLRETFLTAPDNLRVFELVRAWSH